MKIIIMRHFKRGGSPLYDTSLTDEGKKDAKNIVFELNKLKIDNIYCSPFLRTIQSIYPFANRYKKLINIDTALYEGTNDKSFNDLNTMNHHDQHNKKYPYLAEIINKNYRNSLLIYSIIPQEGNKRIIARVHKFIKKLISENKNNTILLVTHQCICNAVKKYFDDSVKLNDDFPMGSYECINIKKTVP